MSGIYIPMNHINMPENCASCRFIVGSGGTFPRELFCDITKKDIADYHAKAADCPLVFVPDHGRLIDADAVDTTYSDPEVIETLETAPTVIPADKDINVPGKKDGAE